MANKDRQNTWLSLQPITGVKFEDGTIQTTAPDGDDATPEGTAIKSTTNSNETSGKVLTADGDGTSSWQTNESTDTVDMGDGFTVSATTDTNATTITEGDDLMFTAGAGITCETTADGTVTITNTSPDVDHNTDTMGSGFVLEDGDGTEVTITENKEVKIVEGTGIDVNWTDTDNGTDGDPYDLTISCDLEGTEVASTTNSNEAVTKFLRADGDGTCSWQNPSVGVAGAFWSSDWVNTDNDSVAVANAATLRFAHSLGSTDVIVRVYANTSASDSGASDVTNSLFWAGANYYGAYITNLTDDDITIQLAGLGYDVPNTSGAHESGGSNTHDFAYIKVVIVAGGVDTTSITPEGTSVKSTTDSNETSGKVLSADGDGTCSWQTVAAISQQTTAAWAKLGDGTGTVVVDDSYNVSSVTDNGTGNYQVDFASDIAANATAVSDCDHNWTGSQSNSSRVSTSSIKNDDPTTTTVSVYCHIEAHHSVFALRDANTIHVIVFAS